MSETSTLYYLDWVPVGSVPMHNYVFSLHIPDYVFKHIHNINRIDAAARADGIFIFSVEFKSSIDSKSISQLAKLDAISRNISSALKKSFGHTHIYHMRDGGSIKDISHSPIAIQNPLSDNDIDRVKCLCEKYSPHDIKDVLVNDIATSNIVAIPYSDINVERFACLMLKKSLTRRGEHAIKDLNMIRSHLRQIGYYKKHYYGISIITCMSMIIYILYQYFHRQQPYIETMYFIFISGIISLLMYYLFTKTNKIRKIRIQTLYNGIGYLTYSNIYTDILKRIYFNLSYTDKNELPCNTFPNLVSCSADCNCSCTHEHFSEIDYSLTNMASILKHKLEAEIRKLSEMRSFVGTTLAGIAIVTAIVAVIMDYPLK